MIKPMHRLAALAAIFLLTLTPLLQADVTLVKEGQPAAVLVIPQDAISDETVAAQELQLHIQKMTGAELPIVEVGQEAGHTAVLIGRAAPAELEDLIRKTTKDESAFALQVGDGKIALRGIITQDVLDKHAAIAQLKGRARSRAQQRVSTLGRGTIIAAYELLEQQGVRWYTPGDWGTVIPQIKTLVVKDQTTVMTPGAPTRYLQAVKDNTWNRRTRQGGMQFPSSHGVPGMPHGKGGELFEQHPEYFSLNDGKRKARQICVSNPEVVARIVEATKEFFRKNPDAPIIGMGANDGRGFCECENCTALDGGDYDPFGGYASMTDRYIWLFNQVLDGIEDEFPDKKIGFYAYSVYNRAPVKTKPNPRIVPAVALITICRLHGMNNPMCPEKDYEQTIIRGWGKVVPEVYYRGYWFNLADPGFPFMMISRIRTDVPLGNALGVKGWRVESLAHWASDAPSHYLATKLMWDDKTDVDALLEEFYTKFFGPAAAPMKRYIELLDTTLRDADYHTGCSWDLPHIYNTTVRNAARAAFDDAMKLAKDPSHQARVVAYAKSWERFEQFARMLETRNQHDYVASKDALDRITAIQNELVSAPEPLLGVKYEEYMRRFFSPATEDGYAKVTGDNKFVVGMGETWEFQIDPEDVGMSLAWYKAKNRGGNWQTISSSSSWGNQGLRYYKGASWYRQDVTIPADAKGKRLFIWFASIDDKATVWINGKLVGASARGTFKPFDLDATAAIKPGENNTVVVLLENRGLNELGTGGIIGPVMFYAPGDPAAEPTGGLPDEKIIEDMETIAGE